MPASAGSQLPGPVPTWLSRYKTQFAHGMAGLKVTARSFEKGRGDLRPFFLPPDGWSWAAGESERLSELQITQIEGFRRLGRRLSQRPIQRRGGRLCPPGVGRGRRRGRERRRVFAGVGVVPATGP